MQSGGVRFNALDPAVSDALQAQLLSDHTSSAGLTRVVDRNLVQGLGVVNTAVIQAQASVSDDSGLMAALQTASRSPEQGQTAK